MANRIFVYICSDADIVLACRMGRGLALGLGFSSTDAALIATAISELVQHIVLYAKTGDIVLQPVEDNGRRGIAVSARDHGPGISNVAYALKGGYSTSGGLGVGLAGTRRLMDEFVISWVTGQGTTVTVKKWAPGGLGPSPLDERKQ